MIFITPEIGTPEVLALEKIDEIRHGLRHALQTPKRWTGFLRRNLLARAIQGSNSIEGYNVTIDEVVAVIEGEEVGAKSETQAALQGYRLALTYVTQLSDDLHFVLNEELIRSLHYMMLSRPRISGLWSGKGCSSRRARRRDAAMSLPRH